MQFDASSKLSSFTINFCSDALTLSNYKKVILFLELLEHKFVDHFFQWVYDEEKQVLVKTNRETLIHKKVLTNEAFTLISRDDDSDYLVFSASNSGPTSTLDSSHHCSLDVQLQGSIEWTSISLDFLATLGDAVNARFGFADHVFPEVYAIRSYDPNIKEKYYDPVHQNVNQLFVDYPEFAALPKLRTFDRFQFPNYAPTTIQWINYWSSKTCDLFHFPDSKNDQRWLIHALKTERDAWVVCLDEHPLELSCARDRQCLVDAYRRFYIP